MSDQQSNPDGSPGPEPAPPSAPPSSDVAEAESAQRRSAGWAVARRCFAAALLVGLIIVTAYSQLTPHLQVCDYVPQAKGAGQVAQNCKAIGFANPISILTLILVIGLIAPDYASIKLVGFIEIEKAIREQGENIRKIEERINNFISSRSASSAESSNNFFVMPQGADLKEILESVNKKAERLEGDDGDSDK